jgi:dTDP-4-dehydrorhamnose reductase
MRIVVTGVRGQIARSLVERGAQQGHHVVPLGQPDLDLAGDPDSIIDAIELARPEVLVSAAAFTAVDKAESEPDQAFAINQRGAGTVAQAARRLSVPLIHISTDYVFNGDKTSPYAEEDETGPTGVYGSSKLAGEQAVLAAHDDCAILRTAWVYSPFGANFVRTMLRLAADRDEIGVVADQRGNPTSALGIADGVLSVALNLARDPSLGRGMFHMTAAGEASWAEFAEAIFEMSGRAGGPTAVVKALTSAEYPTAAKRPSSSRLDSSKLERVHGVRLPHWRGSLEPVVSRIVGSKAATSENG